MGSPEKRRGFAKGDADDCSDGDGVMNADDEDWGGNGKRTHKLSKSKRSSNEEDTNEWDDSSSRRKNSGERNDGRKMSSGSSRGDIGEGDYDVKKESISKQVKNQEDGTLEKLSHWYQDGGLDMNDGGDKSASRSHSRTADDERNASRKANSKLSDHEGSHRRGKDKNERARDGEEDVKALHKDSYQFEMRESGREKGHGFSEDTKSRKTLDSDVNSKIEDSSHAVKSERRNETMSDRRNEGSHERSASSRRFISEGKDRVLDSARERGKPSREESRADSDRSRSRNRSDALEEENKAAAREAADPRRSRSLERSGRHSHELENSEMEHERSSSLKRKDLERDGFNEDRIKDRENSWSDWTREREGSRETWKQRQQGNSDRDVDLVHGRDREWDLPRRGRDNERPVGRIGNRKDGRGEAVKASSNFGILTENYDVIEIQPKPLEYGRDNPASAFSRRSEAVPLHDPKSVKHDDWIGSGDDVTRTKTHGQLEGDDNPSVRNADEEVSAPLQNMWRDDQKSFSPQSSGGRGSRSGSQPPQSNQEQATYGKVVQHSAKFNRPGRGSRVRAPGRDNQQVSMPLPLLGPPFGNLGMPPPGPMPPMNSGMSPAPGPLVPPGVFVSPFSPPVWPGGRGIDMSMLPISPGVSCLLPGPPGQPFSPNIGGSPDPALYFNQSGQGRGMPPLSGPSFSANVPVGRGNTNDRSSGAWIPPKTGGAPGKAPSRGEQNDYSQNFVDTGMRPQNFIRELELTNVEDYPKLRELIQKKDEIVAKAATPPMYHKCDLREFVLSPEFFRTKFDVILIDPPWEEYVHRAPGVTDHMEYWTFEEILNLKIEAITDTPSFIFLWVGDGVGLEQGRQCLKKWGFRRCEDICWVKTNKHTATPALRHDSHTLFQHSKEHCLMGIKGTVRRSTDGHIIHANIDTDVIIAEEPPYGSTAKPEEMYRIIEHFALGRRRIELFGEDHNIRPGWLTVGKGLSSSNFNAEAYVRNFADKDGKVWQGGGGRNPPPDAPHLVQTTPDIEALRPKSPMKNQQQVQPQSNSISLSTASSSSRRATGNSPQNPMAFGLNQEASAINNPWASPMEVFKGPADHAFDMYGYNMPPMQPNGEYLDFEIRE